MKKSRKPESRKPVAGAPRKAVQKRQHEGPVSVAWLECAGAECWPCMVGICT